MTIRRLALVYDDRPRPETTGVYCLRALRGLVEVEHVRPDALDSLPRDAFDLYLNVDDGHEYRLPPDLRPSAWWVIDTHMNLAWDLRKAPDFDCVFAAQRPGAEALRAAGVPGAAWLPLACDPEIHTKHGLPKAHELCFIGNVVAGPRAELLDLLHRHYPGMLIDRRYFEDMARAYSASKLVFNRSVRDDVNMRVFEALACGSLLLTNDLAGQGQAELFRDGVHLATFRDAEELLDKARFYLAREEVRERVAAAGRAEALANHTYRHRMERLLAEAERHLGRVSETVSGLPPAAPAPGDARDCVYFDFERPELVALVPESARDVLDIGCGAGRLGAALKARQGARVTGVECDPAAAQAARARLDRVVEGDVEALEPDWGPGAFDAAVCGDVLEHLRDPAALLRKVHTWLRPGGALVVSVPNVRHHSVVRGLLAGHWTYQAAGLLDRTHLRFFTRRELEKLLFRAGFRLTALTFVPGAEHADWVAAGRPGEVRVGPLCAGGLAPEEAEEFHAYQYLATAEPAPARDDGLTSVVVVTHNELDCTRRCLESLRLVTDEPYELIVVDNASFDGTPEYLRALPGVRAILNDDNRGFPAAANQGIRAARGRQVLLLNNDTVLTTGWLRRLLDALHRYPDAGLVGPCSDRVNGRQRVAAAYDPEFLDGFAWDWGKAHAGEVEEAEALSGFCLLARKEVFDRVGLLDERFGLGCLEDDDLCRRARRAGYQCLVARDAFVRHLGHRSFAAAGVDQDALYQRNLVLFRKKWEAEDGLPAGTLDCGLTSIVVITHNQLAFTRGCVESVRRSTAEPYEFVFVDNGSTDGSPDYLRSVPNATVVANPENRGFPAAANQGIRAARGEQVLLLNNDTVVPAGWLGRLLRPLAEDPAVGLVGPCSNFVSGEQQVESDYRDLEGLEEFAARHAARHAGTREETDRLVGFCLLIRRAVLDRVGLLDERFGLGCFEDDDLCRRARAAGFRAVIARDAFVHHYGGLTFRSTGVDFAGLIRANQEQFRRKWDGGRGEAPAPESDAVRPAPAPAGPDGPRVLIIAHVGFLRDRLDQSLYIRYGALARRPGVTLFGPGLPGYRPGMTAREAVEVACGGTWPDVILHGTDLYESGRPLVEGLAEAPTLTAIELVDSWARQEGQADFVRRQRFALGLILERGHHLDYYRDNCPGTEFHWAPNAVDTSQFRDWGLAKRYDVIVYGNTDAAVYPLRARLAGLLRRQTEFSVRHIPHPGYYPSAAERAAVVSGEALSRAINEAWVGIADCGIYRVFFMKYLEIAASGALVAGDLPESARPVFGDDFLELSLGQSDEEVLAALRSALADKHRLRERIDAARRRVAEGLSTDAFADRVLDLFRSALARRGNGADVRARAGSVAGTAPTVAPAPPEAASAPVFTVRRGEGGGLYLGRREVVLSLCMIARDNARTITAALESVRPWVDEMVVVDTGSADGTPALCARLGARVSHFAWVDDFAAARNESLRLARGRWLFWMDSDDTIDPDCGRRLRELAYGASDPKVLGYVVRVRCPGPAAASDLTVVDHVKLVRNHPEIRFEGRIHEQVLPSIRRLGGEVAWTDLFVTHSGYDHSPGGQARKLERDLRLLHLDLAERPEHPFVLFNLGMTYADAGRPAEAAGYLRQSIAAAGPGESHLRKAYALLASCHERDCDWEAAWEACVEGLAQYPLDAELRFRKGLLLHARGRLREAAAAYEDLLARREEGRHFASAADGVDGHLARHNLALAYEELGEYGRAEEQWRRLMRERPDYEPGRRGLDLLRRRAQSGNNGGPECRPGEVAVPAR
jgi:GT2 family glycosyltransferase/2-polyprenyl-3-methyl-5-hydroxy-6-metoxy-1,4-benzoquinol methylase/tetratricopeptide (TPR) repeat protein